MKIFLSYGHDSNSPLIEKIKDFLSKDADGNLKHEVWIDTSEIKAGKDWREKITSEPLENVSLKVKPEQKAKLRICPMSIEPRAEFPGDMKNYYHFGEI